MNLRPAAIILKNNEVLLLKYVYNEIVVYNLPGGNQENNDTIGDTLKREMQEELGVKIEIEDLLFVTETNRFNSGNSVLHFIFGSKITENEPIINKNETSATDVVWLPISQLNQVNLYPSIGIELYNYLKNGSKKTYLGKIDQPWF